MSIRLATILRVVSKLRLATTSLREKIKDFIEDGLYNKDPEVVFEALKVNLGSGSKKDLLLKAPTMLHNKEFITEVVKLAQGNFNREIKEISLFLLEQVKHDYAFQVELAVAVPSCITSLPAFSKDMVLNLIKLAVHNSELQRALRKAFHDTGRVYAKDEDILLKLAMHLPELFVIFAPDNIKKDPDFIQVLMEAHPNDYMHYLK